MKIEDHINMLSLKIIPRAKKTEWGEMLSDGTYKLKIQAIPEDGRANMEILDFLKTETGKEWKILSGRTSSRKIVRSV